MKPPDFAFVLSFSFGLAGALGAAGCAAQAAAPPPNGPPPPELQIGGDDEAQGEADPPPPPSAPPPAHEPTAPGPPPPPPTEAGQMAPPSQPAAGPSGPAPATPPPGPAPVAQGPAPVAQGPAPVAQGPAPNASGQWIHTSQYGWLWLPYSRDYTYVSADGGTAYEYAYYPNSGWRWVYSPWVLGWGPSPYWGRVGPRRYVWYSRPWFRVGVVHRGPVYHRRWHRR